MDKQLGAAHIFLVFSTLFWVQGVKLQGITPTRDPYPAPHRPAGDSRFPLNSTAREVPLVDPPALAHPTSASLTDAHSLGLVFASRLEPGFPLVDSGRLHSALFVCLAIACSLTS